MNKNRYFNSTPVFKEPVFYPYMFEPADRIAEYIPSKDKPEYYLVDSYK